MANPTTNYSWQMPTSTDLVTDLPADFEVFGQAVDTTVKANADAAVAKTLIDAKGDLIAGTAADTAGRLAVGTNGQVLLADSTASTGLAWGTPAAGSMTLLSTTTLSGASTTISSISQSYKHLYLDITGVNLAANNTYYVKPNGDATNCGYVRQGYKTLNGYNYAGYGDARIDMRLDAQYVSANTNNAVAMTIFNYASTSTLKVTQESGYYAAPSGDLITWEGGSSYKSTSAISSLVLETGSTFSAGTVKLYGVN